MFKSVTFYGTTDYNEIIHISSKLSWMATQFIILVVACKSRILYECIFTPDLFSCYFFSQLFMVQLLNYQPCNSTFRRQRIIGSQQEAIVPFIFGSVTLDCKCNGLAMTLAEKSVHGLGVKADQTLWSEFVVGNASKNDFERISYGKLTVAIQQIQYAEVQNMVLRDCGRNPKCSDTFYQYC